MITVAVSGGFDPLHVGHIEMMEKAKALGDKLLVIVNDDDFLMRKKGYVFMPLKERIKVIESLRVVDCVVVAVDKDQTVCKSLKLYKPNIFANGGDRGKGNIPEEDICKELGIEMVWGLGEKIQSSSDLVRRGK